MKKLFWTDAHTNPHTDQIKELKEWLEHAKEVIDFWPVAYYPYYMRKVNGFGVEDIYDKEIVDKDWQYLQQFVKENNKEGEFPIFLGYEWQGSGLDGDHNVFYLEDDQPLHRCMRYSELCEKLPEGKAIAIPHHLAYQVGDRGKNWETHNDTYSPFVEIFSSHGCSESDRHHLPMLRHIHMGPRAYGTSVTDGLKHGHRIGIIASGDNHALPAVYNHGYMGVWAEENTRESLWHAMLNKCVYGVTGDKISLCYQANNALMGQSVKAKGDKVNHKISVEASDSIHRIELYQNEQLVKDLTHTGKWENTEFKGSVAFKFRLELGWGPDTRVFPDITTRVWQGSLNTTGRIIDVEKCWTAMGQSLKVDKSSAEFSLTTHKTTQTGKWMGPSPIENQALVFHIEADIDSDLVLDIDGYNYKVTVRELLQTGQLHGLVEEAHELIATHYDVQDHYRNDPFWHNAYKIKVHQAIPEQAFKLDCQLSTTSEQDVDVYRVKIFQTNGHMAWSSPIWVDNT